MGREIRRVPANWDHPKVTATRLVPYRGLQLVEEFQPMFDRDFDQAAKEWRDEFIDWEAKGRAEHKAETGDDLEYWEYCGNPPDRKYYRPWKQADATWLQLWETVSEGTPVTPAFATIEELAAHLAQHGDAWDQKRGHGGWGRARADAFCRSGYACSFVVADGRILEPKDQAFEMERIAQNRAPYGGENA